MEKGQSESQLGLKYVGEGPWVNYVPGKPDVTQAQYDVQSAVVPTAIANPASSLFSDAQSRKGSQIGRHPRKPRDGHPAGTEAGSRPGPKASRSGSATAATPSATS